VSSSRWLRFVSPAYRDALKAEAEGRYVEAARAYAIVGESLKVAEMHILEAECQGAPASALRELHVASHFVDEAAETAQGRALLLRLGQIYLRILRKSVLTPAEHEICAFAAELLLRAGTPHAAAEAYELAGDLARAAQAYEQAGEIEKVEALHDRLARQRDQESEEQALWQRFELHRSLGQRPEALACIERLCQVARDPSSAQHERAQLRARLLSPFVVRLRLREHGHAAEGIFAGRLPIVLGRGAGPLADAGGSLSAEPAHPEAGARGATGLWLADPGLSRSHAQLERSPLAETQPQDRSASADHTAGARFALRDLGSKNGSSLNGLPIGSTMAVPLRGVGEIGLGQHVRMQFAQPAHEDSLRLTVTRGLSRGLCIWLCEGAISLHLPRLLSGSVDAALPAALPVDPVAAAPGQPLAPTAAAPMLRFAADDGQPWLHTETALFLDGKPVASPVQILRGDVLRIGDALGIEVL
jgi:tetratricopeptide (TPR) repeat protein